MSDDIVTRLRKEWAGCSTCMAGNEAADEIERLRADRDRWQMKYDDTHKCLRALGNYND